MRRLYLIVGIAFVMVAAAVSVWPRLAATVKPRHNRSPG